MTEGQKDRRTERQTDRKKDRQIERQRDAEGRLQRDREGQRHTQTATFGRQQSGVGRKETEVTEDVTQIVIASE